MSRRDADHAQTALQILVRNDLHARGLRGELLARCRRWREIRDTATPAERERLLCSIYRLEDEIRRGVPISEPLDAEKVPAALAAGTSSPDYAAAVEQQGADEAAAEAAANAPEPTPPAADEPGVASRLPELPRLPAADHWIATRVPFGSVGGTPHVADVTLSFECTDPRAGSTCEEVVRTLFTSAAFAPQLEEALRRLRGNRPCRKPSGILSCGKCDVCEAQDVLDRLRIFRLAQARATEAR